MQRDKVRLRVCDIGRDKTIPGLCNEERSMISPDYARNFICDFILGKVQNGVATQMDLFGEADHA